MMIFLRTHKYPKIGLWLQVVATSGTNKAQLELYTNEV